MPDVGADKRLDFRIGINVGDIVEQDGDIFGDGVNIAARLEGIAEPGGICVSGARAGGCRGKDCSPAFEDIGEQTLKNIARPIRVYRLRPGERDGSPPHPCARRSVFPTNHRSRSCRSRT